MDDIRLESKLDDLLRELKDLSINLAKMGVKLEQLEAKYERLSDTPTALLNISNALQNLSQEIARNKEDLFTINRRLGILENNAIDLRDWSEWKDRVSQIESKLSKLNWFFAFSDSLWSKILYVLTIMILFIFAMELYNNIDILFKLLGR